MDPESVTRVSAATTVAGLPGRDGREADEVRRVAGETRAADAGHGLRAGPVDRRVRAFGHRRVHRAGRERRVDER
ncbi:hypothetical protein Shyhy01_66750 [Streptomyces hygroscopicus subsp. hygroscopicus]|nr:hypothetical protein Shyhy01_66750 [Streptomyces hygroscopicus subsp. hygroscopicus]